jgi:dTDP-4-dehydrorhamnose reductase
MRVLILGATGMLGHKLLQTLARRCEATGTVRADAAAWRRHPVLGPLNLVGPVRAEAFDEVVRAFAAARPEVVVNAIGLVKQRPEAADPVACLTLNALFPHRVAALCRATGARLIHVSTDCVFSGRKGGYTEADACDAEDLYGRAKLLGEVGGPGCLTLRTSLVGRELGAGLGLVEWFLARRGGRVNGYARAVFSGLTTLALADLVGDLVNRSAPLEGVWHVAAQPISKHDLLGLVDRAFAAGVAIDRDETVTCDRSLDGGAFRRVTGYAAPAWPAMVRDMAADPTPYEEARRPHAD